MNELDNYELDINYENFENFEECVKLNDIRKIGLEILNLDKKIRSFSKGKYRLKTVMSIVE